MSNNFRICFSKKRYTLIALSLFMLLIASKTHLQAKGNVVILFTSDIHSNCKEKQIRYSNPYYKDTTLVGYIVGGYPKLATIIEREKKLAKENDDALIVVDAGDISMGTPFQTLFTKNAFDLVSFGKMGYDAVTFGNHCFDFGIDSTALMLEKSLKFKDSLNLPSILSLNLLPSQNTYPQKIFNLYGIVGSKIFTKNNIKIGVIGASGDNSYSVISNKLGIEYNDNLSLISNEAKLLKDSGADYVILLYHGGAKNVAKSLKNIDVIISGHDHDIYYTPTIINDIIIGASGAYNNYVGKIELGNNKLQSYNLIPILDTITSNKQLTLWVENNQIIVDSIFKNTFGVCLMDSLNYISTNYSREYDANGNLDLGYHIARSYSKIAKRETGYDNVIGIVPDGLIRSTLAQGSVTNYDVFNILSLGTNSTGAPGYPLVMAWLNGKEIKDLCELVATISPGLPDSRLYFYGIEYKYDPLRIPFTRVFDIRVFGEDVSRTKLYPIVTGLYTARLIELLRSESFGLLSALPKDVNNNIIDTIDSYIISNNIPEWFAFASYLKDGDYMDKEQIKSGAIKRRTYNIIFIYILFIGVIGFIAVRTLLKLFRKL